MEEWTFSSEPPTALEESAKLRQDANIMSDNFHPWTQHWEQKILVNKIWWQDRLGLQYLDRLQKEWSPDKKREREKKTYL